MYSGYWNKPDVTVATWRNLWHHTGDFGRMDERGCVSFVDRMKDRLRRRGENISSMHLEETLRLLPGVADVAVSGLPGQLGDDDIKACLVETEPGALSAAAVFEFLRDRVAVLRDSALRPHSRDTAGQRAAAGDEGPAAGRGSARRVLGLGGARPGRGSGRPARSRQGPGSGRRRRLGPGGQRMTEVITSRIDPADEIFQLNRTIMLQRLAEIGELTAAVNAGGGEPAVRRHRARGRMLIRERIELLIDPHEYFLELSPLAAWDSRFADGASMVTGVGVVEGTECVLIGNDFTIRGGSINPYTMRKMLRAFAIADENRLPVIMMTESGGGDLPAQADSFVEGGRLFRDLSDLSKKRIPTIDIVFGNATAGGAYQPGMSDYAILIRDQSHVFLGGPPLVKMATGEDADPESLGGGEMHATVSGLADYLASDEYEALRITRSIVRHLNWRKLGGPPGQAALDPLLDGDDLLGIASHDLKIPFDPREVIARVADGSRFEEFKPLYGRQLVTGWAAVHGYPVGIVANHGILMSEESEKGAQFIALCNQIDVPLLFFQNTTGFVVGTEYERGAITKNGVEAGPLGLELTGSAHNDHDGRQLWRRELRHVGPRLPPPVRVLLAEPPHRR